MAKPTCNLRNTDSHVSYLFRRLSRFLRLVHETAEPTAVHQLRTTIRRVTTLVSPGDLQDKQVARFENTLSKLFAKAGKVRDLDVQIEALKSLTLPSVAEDKARLLAVLGRRRSKRARRLIDALERALDDGLAKRQRKVNAILSRTAREKTSFGLGASSLQLDLVPFLQKIRHAQFTTETLHDFRLEVKHLRYRAETSGAAGTEVARALKPLQDAIGTWHDWFSLAAFAESELIHTGGHPILPLLRTKAEGYVSNVHLVLKKTHAALSSLMKAEPMPRPVAPARIEPAQTHVAKVS